ncbi:MAG: hypothetical protein JJV93_00630 [Alphaproteobacteria bacterium]|nr:hypothetical protein [Alphaproteobacteria bacterium]MBL0717758.1 hypothetical protein [Alphaproteobacteria bacterium]
MKNLIVLFFCSIISFNQVNAVIDRENDNYQSGLPRYMTRPISYANTPGYLDKTQNWMLQLGNETIGMFLPSFKKERVQAFKDISDNNTTGKPVAGLSMDYASTYNTSWAEFEDDTLRSNSKDIIQRNNSKACSEEIEYCLEQQCLVLGNTFKRCLCDANIIKMMISFPRQTLAIEGRGFYNTVEAKDVISSYIDEILQKQRSIATKIQACISQDCMRFYSQTFEQYNKKIQDDCARFYYFIKSRG